MRTRRQERAEAVRAAAATGYGQREWEVGELLAPWLSPAKDKLDNALTRSRDIAALAMTCRAFSTLAKRTLWAQLGAQFPARPAASAEWPAGFTVIPEHLGYIAKQLRCNQGNLKLRNMDRLPAKDRLAAKAELAWEYKHTVPQSVPCHIFTEVKSLRSLGMAASSAKKVFKITEKDLKELPCITVNRGRLGTAHIYKLPELMVAARAKHGSDAAVEAKAAKVKRNRQAAQASRKQALADGLQQLGVTLTPDITGVALVTGYLEGAKGAIKDVQEVVRVAQLINWCLKHTHYNSIKVNADDGEKRYYHFKVMFKGHEGSYFNSTHDRAMKAAEKLSNQEEWHCINLAVQMWAKARGGAAAALARPSVPARGRLRASIKALAAHVDDYFRMDAGCWSDDADWDEQGQEEGNGDSDEEESEAEEEEDQGGSSDGEGESHEEGTEGGSGEEENEGE